MPASNEGSSNDAEREARRAASILHQTPGWRWRRKLCLTERTQQRQSGPWWKVWFHDRCNRVDRDACRGGNVVTRVRHRQSTCEKQCQRLGRNACRRGNVGRVRGTVLGMCGEHCARAAWKGRARAGCTARMRSTREWTALFQRNLADNGVAAPRDTREHPLEDAQMAASERVRVAQPDSVVWTSAGSTARKRYLDECG